ncbi:MAG: DUF4292 domain-containing protein [Muribaculaceae bacterium]|nr:DUF4292 domain-containing protein [Muribaculaceae bacterium]
MKLYRLIIMTMCAAALIACSSQKKVTDTTQTTQPDNPTVVPAVMSEAQRLDAIVASLGGWNTMKTNGSMSINGAGKSFSSAMQMRMVRDEVIYISLRPLLGIEAGRLLIKGDSLFVINKLQKLYIAEKVSLLTAGVPATVGMMQDMFLGRPFVMGEGSLNPSRKSKVDVTIEDGGCHVLPKAQPKDFTYCFTYDADNRILSVDVKLTKGGEAYSMNYGDVRRTLAGNVAHQLKFSTDIKGKSLKLDLDYDRITWNEEVDASFSIPSSYKRQDGRSLLGMFQ